jgi:hypothetical protein
MFAFTVGFIKIKGKAFLAYALREMKKTMIPEAYTQMT